MRKRRRFTAEFKRNVAPEALSEHATVADLAHRWQVHPNQIYSCKKHQMEQAARAFESGVGNGAADRDRQIERGHPKIGELIVERVFWRADPGRERLGPQSAR